MELKDFKPVDLVQVKSCEPVMTVEKTGTSATFGDGAVSCVWFEKVSSRRVAQDKSFRAPRTSALVGILRA